MVAAYPRRRVILLKPDSVSLTNVVKAVMELAHYGEAEATYRMWDAHYAGRAVVLEAHLERAELYVELFAERGLATTLEPV